MSVKFVDTTMRDGAQSLWASWMSTGTMEAIAPELDKAGFHAIELPVIPIFFKKRVRDLKEDPWEMLRLMGRLIKNTRKTFMGGINLNSFDMPPREMVRLFYQVAAATGACDRIQLIANTMDQRTKIFPWLMPILEEVNIKVCIALAYQISPRHTDKYYADLARDVRRFKPEAMYLKDPGGLVTVDRARTLIPAILEAAGDIPVEFHSHCTTGQAPVTYMEAARLGIKVLHTGTPPLADGSAQPSIFNVYRNLQLQDRSPILDLSPVRVASKKLTEIAQIEGLPIGAPSAYDCFQYKHQVPGGVISNLKFQLGTIGMADRLDEVLEEVVRVQQELGYPMMITPYSQYVVTQSAINVSSGQRYGVVTDEVIRFTQGAYGVESGYQDMDQNLKDRILSSARAAELVGRDYSDQTVKEIRATMGAESLDDEELLLRYIMGGSVEVDAMRRAGPYKRYDDQSQLATLLKTIKTKESIRYISLSSGKESVVLANR